MTTAEALAAGSYLRSRDRRIYPRCDNCGEAPRKLAGGIPRHTQSSVSLPVEPALTMFFLCKRCAGLSGQGRGG